tara:strand:+ start:462 stop:749 length:288 start_codon:yes stop_codon:yes gene_type:complete
MMKRSKEAGADFGPDWPGKRCTARSKRTGDPCRNPAVLGWNVCRMHGARGGRPARSGPDWRQAAKILRRLDHRWRERDTTPLPVTVIIAAGRDPD